MSDAIEREPKIFEEREGGRPAFRWAGEDSARTGIVRARRLRNGDLIVVPATYGGCDQWGWNPQSDDEVIDLGEAARWPYRARRFAVRVTPELIAQGLRQEVVASEQQEVRGTGTAINLDPIRSALTAKLLVHEGDRPADLLGALLDNIGGPALPRQMGDYLEALHKPNGRLQTQSPYDSDDDHGRRGIVFFAPRGVKTPDAAEPIGLPATESDDLGAFSRCAVSLIDHSRHVRDWARDFANRAGLGQNVIAAVALAGFLHDAGKADPRFQAYFAGGDPYGPDVQQVLAKSGERRLIRGAWRRAGFCGNWRHEALSVRLALIHPSFPQATERALVLWLIGSHHGFGRPLFPHTDVKDADIRLGLLKAYGTDDTLPPGHGPQSLAFDFDRMDWTQMFEALKRRHGIWGLARLEALLRLADHRASEAVAGPGAEAEE
ncbi:MAG: CRISPR-associated endonuclease Cas3'' [Stellaceae bacterium]